MEDFWAVATEAIIGIAVGLALVVIGILNTKGNVSMLHGYHTKRVSEEDRIPFGKKVGCGTIIMGAGIVAFGALSLVSNLTTQSIYQIVGYVVMGVTLIVGSVIVFGAMKKYNKGIF